MFSLIRLSSPSGIFQALKLNQVWRSETPEIRIAVITDNVKCLVISDGVMD